MPRFTDYEIIVGDPPGIVQEMKKRVLDGWEPCGGITVLGPGKVSALQKEPTILFGQAIALREKLPCEPALELLDTVRKAHDG